MSVTNNFDILSYPSRHYSSRNNAEISAVIVHSVGMPLLRDVFSAFEQYQVSAHYLVPPITAQELIDLMPDIFGNSNFQMPYQLFSWLMIAKKHFMRE